MSRRGESAHPRLGVLLAAGILLLFALCASGTVALVPITLRRAALVDAGDRARELVKNAADSVQDGGMPYVESRTVEVHGIPYARLGVYDTGCGIAADALGHVFDPFYSTRSPGRGLGFAAVRGIVQNHGGRVLLWSDEGRGTCVVADLPADVAGTQGGEP